MDPVRNLNFHLRNLRLVLLTHASHEASLGPPRWWLGWSILLAVMGDVAGAVRRGP